MEKERNRDPLAGRLEVREGEGGKEKRGREAPRSSSLHLGGKRRKRKKGKERGTPPSF